jgi:predicted nucleic acid-binding protein
MVVSNTSPLNYIVLVKLENILPQLYEEIWIPPAVRAELLNPATPSQVRRFVDAPPEWLRIGQPRATDESSLSHLDRGEIEAILLAQQMNAHALIIDDRAGARAGQLGGLRVAGTLGALDRAARLGLIDLRRALQDLQQTTFRMPIRIMRQMLEEYRTRLP